VNDAGDGIFPAPLEKPAYACVVLVPAASQGSMSACVVVWRVDTWTGTAYTGSDTC
jgi:hypothetical protein